MYYTNLYSFCFINYIFSHLYSKISISDSKTNLEPSLLQTRNKELKERIEYSRLALCTNQSQEKHRSCNKWPRITYRLNVGCEIQFECCRGHKSLQHTPNMHFYILKIEIFQFNIQLNIKLVLQPWSLVECDLMWWFVLSTAECRLLKSFKFKAVCALLVFFSFRHFPYKRS